MNFGIVAVTLPLKIEVLEAVTAVKRPNCVYVSRGSLEIELEDHPERYPILGAATRPFRRQVISKVMKRQFSIWGDTSSKKHNTFVWDITRPVEVAV